MNEREPSKGLQDWMRAGKNRTDRIPLETKGEWLDIEYEMLPLGKTREIWGSSEGLIANIEREAEHRQEKGGKSSKAVIAQLVQSFYTIGCIEQMVKKLNGVPVTPSWFQLECSQSLGSLLQVWMNGVLLHRPYPKPAWLLQEEGRIEEAEAARKRGTLQGATTDPPLSSPALAGEDGDILLEPYSPEAGR